MSKETIQAFHRVIKKRSKIRSMEIDGHKDFLFINSKGKPKVAIDYTTPIVAYDKEIQQAPQGQALATYHTTYATPYVLHKVGKQEYEPNRIYSISWGIQISVSQ